jgi:hypothetical protein
MTTTAWSTRRSIATVVALVALGVGACGSDDGDVAETGETTEAPATVVTPVVVCADDQRGATYWGYTNSGDEAVTIAVGEGNSVTLADGTEVTAAQPAVFAPGEQGVVFWTDYFAGPVTWQITGEDGTPQAATADESAPACPEGGPALDPPDDREVTVEADVDTSGAAPVITLSAAGMSDESRCPSGDHDWTPEAPVAAFAVVGQNVETLESEDSVVVLEVVDPASEPVEGFDLVGYASAFVTIDVEDHCTDASGATSEAWGASESLRDLSQVGIRICFGVTDSGYDEVDCSEGPTLAPTGGIRAR